MGEGPDPDGLLAQGCEFSNPTSCRCLLASALGVGEGSETQFCSIVQLCNKRVGLYIWLVLSLLLLFLMKEGR